MKPEFLTYDDEKILWGVKDLETGETEHYFNDEQEALDLANALNKAVKFVVEPHRLPDTTEIAGG